MWFPTAGNRVSFRELAGLNQLINFVGHPEWADLHVFAIATLANCLDDLDSVKVCYMRITYIYHTYPENDELLVEHIASSNLDFQITCVTLLLH